MDVAEIIEVFYESGILAKIIIQPGEQGKGGLVLSKIFKHPGRQIGHDFF